MSLKFPISLVGKRSAGAGLLDQYAGAAAAYSLRELSDSWAGQPVIRVYRANDGATQDFTAAEITDGTMATFCGSSGGFIEIWYDQPNHQKHPETKIEPSWLGVPMVIGKNVIGVIAIHHETDENIYDEDDLKILSAIANSAAIAIDNARLTDKLLMQNKRKSILNELGQELTLSIQLTEEEIAKLDEISEQITE